VSATTDPQSIHVCFVCLGNICRSPTAEGVMLKLLADADLGERVRIDSAGTGAWHVGERADARSRQEARARGIELPSIARQFEADDFDRFDYVIAMDRQNLRDLQRLAREATHRDKLHLLREFEHGAAAATVTDLDVPDPYYGGDDGFAAVFDIVERGCRNLLQHLRERHGL
jgi:protein-tyrosine phosphatase